MGHIFSRSENHVINRNLNSISWLWIRKWYPRPGPGHLHSSPGLAGKEGEQGLTGTENMFLVSSLHLGTGLLAASLALLRVWLQPSTSSRWQRLRDQRPIQQGRDQLTTCSGRRLLPKPANSGAGRASRGTKGIGTGPASPSPWGAILGRCLADAGSWGSHQSCV